MFFISAEELSVFIDGVNEGITTDAVKYNLV